MPIDRYLAHFVPRKSWVVGILLFFNLVFAWFIVLCLIRGFMSRYLADDFILAWRAREFGLWGASVWWYTYWDGRYTATFLVDLASLVTPGQCWYFTAITLILWIGSGWSIASTLARFGVIPSYFRLMVALLPIYYTFLVYVDLFQPLYWECGIVTCSLPVALLVTQGALLLQLYFVRLSKERLVLYSILCVVLAFLLSGFNEYIPPVQIAVYGVALFGILRLDKQDRPRILWSLGGALAAATVGMVIVLHAPGNVIRAATYPHRPAGLHLLLLTLHFYGRFIYRYTVLCPNTLPNFLLIAGLCASPQGRPSDTLRGVGAGLYQMAALALFGALLIFVCFLVTTYAIAAAPEYRTLFTPVALLSMTLIAVGVVLGRLFKSFYSLIPQRIRRWSTPILVIAVLVQLVPSLIFYSIRDRDQADECSGAAMMAKKWDVDNAYLESQRGKPLVRVVGEDYEGWHLSTDPRYWVNIGDASYYHIGEIETYGPGAQKGPW